MRSEKRYHDLSPGVSVSEPRTGVDEYPASPRGPYRNGVALAYRQDIDRQDAVV